MKYLSLLALLFLPALAVAQVTNIKPLHPENVTMIDGKKFFSLNSARRQTSTSPTPQALAVINSPRPDVRRANRLPMVQAPAASAATTTVPSAAAGTATPAASTATTAASPPLTGAAAQKAQLLSIFAPDTK